MTTVSEVITFLEAFAPPELAEDWDNVGLLIGRRDVPVTKILTCLTLTPDVAAEAVECGVQLVVSHHPVLFRGAKKITDGNSEGRLLLSLIENGVAVFSPHTCFDSAAGGINQQLAESFGLSGIQPIRSSELVEGLGSGRVGAVSGNLKLSSSLSVVRTAVAGDYLEFSGTKDSVVSKVAVACGAAAEFLEDAIAMGCDTFVTGEARFHAVLAARTAGVNLILLGHYSSERPAVEQLASMLNAEFDGVGVQASRVECDPLMVFVS